jgi:hypothetical protein
MLREKESMVAWTDRRTLVKTAAPNAIPRTTIRALTGCSRMYRRLNQP